MADAEVTPADGCNQSLRCRPPLPRMKLPTSWTIGPTAQERYKKLIKHYTSIREPQERHGIEEAEEQQRRQVIFIARRLQVASYDTMGGLDGLVCESTPASTSNPSSAPLLPTDGCSRSDFLLSQCSSVSTTLSRQRLRPLSALEFRRARAIDRFNSKSTNGRVIPSLTPVDSVGNDAEDSMELKPEDLNLSSTFSGARFSRPATGDVHRTSVSQLNAGHLNNSSRINLSRPQSGQFQLRRPNSAAFEGAEKMARARRHRHELSVLYAHIEMMERAWLREYRNLLEAALREREEALFGSPSPNMFSVRQPRVFFCFANYVQKSITPTVLNHLEHSLVCIRSCQMKSELRRLGYIPADDDNARIGTQLFVYAEENAIDSSFHSLMIPHTKCVRPTTPKRHTVTPAYALGSNQWQLAKSLSILNGPKAAKVTMSASTKCNHIQQRSDGEGADSQSLMANSISVKSIPSSIALHQVAALERFSVVICRIQSIWRGLKQRRIYLATRSNVLLLQRIGAAYLERRLYLYRLRTIILQKHEEDMLKRWLPNRDA